MASEREVLSVTERCRLCLLDNGFMISLHDELVESKLKDLTKCTCIDVSLNNTVLAVFAVSLILLKSAYFI